MRMYLNTSTQMVPVTVPHFKKWHFHTCCVTLHY